MGARRAVSGTAAGRPRTRVAKSESSMAMSSIKLRAASGTGAPVEAAVRAQSDVEVVAGVAAASDHQPAPGLHQPFRGHGRAVERHADDASTVELDRELTCGIQRAHAPTRGG